MPFKDLFHNATARATSLANQHKPQPHIPTPTSYSQPSTPPIPPNKPHYSPASPQSYWSPSFPDSIPVSQNFKHQLGAHGWGNNELQNYTSEPSSSFHAHNALVVRATASNGQYTSARLTSHVPLSKPRGSLQIVATAPSAQGIWPAIWLLPREPFTWPQEGEVDILESWNGDVTNHTCLHWGHYNGEDHDKHRVVETALSGGGPHAYEFVWEQERDEDGAGGKLVWYIDGRCVMKAGIPRGTRRLSDWQVIINVAMGGNVCGGRKPGDGIYDLVVSELRLCDEPRVGWGRFEADWQSGREGHTM